MLIFAGHTNAFSQVLPFLINVINIWISCPIQKNWDSSNARDKWKIEPAYVRWIETKDTKLKPKVDTWTEGSWLIYTHLPRLPVEVEYAVYVNFRNAYLTFLEETNSKDW